MREPQAGQVILLSSLSAVFRKSNTVLDVIIDVTPELFVGRCVKKVVITDNSVAIMMIMSY